MRFKSVLFHKLGCSYYLSVMIGIKADHGVESI